MEIMHLHESFKRLQATVKEFREALLSQQSPDIFLGGKINNDSDGDQNPLSIVANSLCMMWYGDRKYPFVDTEGGGVMCVNDDAWALAHKVNEAKAEFKSACFDASAGKRSTAKRLLGADKSRNVLLDERLKSLGLGQLDLWKCYKKITLMDLPLRRIGWTWQRNHSEMTPKTLNEAIALCNNMRKSDMEYDQWIRTLVNLPAHYQIVRIITKLPQLRANLSFAKELNLKNKQVPSPSIILLSSRNQPALPEHTFVRLTDINSFKLPRTDKIIDDTHQLGFLNLYAYSKHSNGQAA